MRNLLCLDNDLELSSSSKAAKDLNAKEVLTRRNKSQINFMMTSGCFDSSSVNDQN